MEKVFQAVLILHIICGTTGLLTGTTIMILQKGGKVHRNLGKVFFAGMTGVFVTSLYMSMVKSNWFLLCVGFFSFYLAASGYRVLNFKTSEAYKRPIAAVDHLLGTGGLAASVGLWILGAILWLKGDSFGIVPVVFGSISGYFAVRSYRLFFHPPTDKKQWIRSHAIRMTGAFVSTVTAFAVVNIQMDPNWVLWLLPAAILTPLGSFQMKRFIDGKSSAKKTAALSMQGLNK